MHRSLAAFYINICIFQIMYRRFRAVRTGSEHHNTFKYFNNYFLYNILSTLLYIWMKAKILRPMRSSCGPDDPLKR